MALTPGQAVDFKGSLNALSGEWRTHRELTFTCIGDSDGSIAATAINAANLKLLMGTYLSRFIVTFGSPAPDDDADITFTDEYGFDVLGGLGANALDSATNSGLLPIFSTYLSGIPLIGPLTLTVTNQTVDSAEWDIICIFTDYPIPVTVT